MVERYLYLHCATEAPRGLPEQSTAIFRRKRTVVEVFSRAIAVKYCANNSFEIVAVGRSCSFFEYTPNGELHKTTRTREKYDLLKDAN